MRFIGMPIRLLFVLLLWAVFVPILVVFNPHELRKKWGTIILDPWDWVTGTRVFTMWL